MEPVFEMKEILSFSFPSFFSSSNLPAPLPPPRKQAAVPITAAHDNGFQMTERRGAPATFTNPMFSDGDDYSAPPPSRAYESAADNDDPGYSEITLWNAHLPASSAGGAADRVYDELVSLPSPSQGNVQHDAAAYMDVAPEPDLDLRTGRVYDNFLPPTQSRTPSSRFTNVKGGSGSSLL